MKSYRILFLLCFIFNGVINLTAQKDTTVMKSDSAAAPAEFNFNHNLSRMFSIPTGNVLNSLDLSLLVGSSFSFGSTNNYLGTASLGLGGYGDIELSSASLMGSIFNREESFSHIGMKIKLLTETERLPFISIGLKTNNEWNNSSSASGDILSNSDEMFNQGLRGVNFDSRMTSAYISLTKTIQQTAVIHAGISYSDLRIKNVNVIYNYWNSVYLKPEEEIRNIFNFFGGIEFKLNERTTLMVEAQSLPFLDVNSVNGRIEPERRILGAAGLRFLISSWLLVDSGILYQDNYKGLADAQLKLSLNGIWNLKFK